MNTSFRSFTGYVCQSGRTATVSLPTNKMHDPKLHIQSCNYKVSQIYRFVLILKHK